MPDEAIELLVLGNTTPEVEVYLDTLRNRRVAAHALRIDHNADILSEELKKKKRLDLLIYTVEDSALDVTQLLALLGAISSTTPVIAVSEEVNDELRIELMQQGIADLVPRAAFEHLAQVILREYKNLKIRRHLQLVERQLEEAEERCDALTKSSRDAIAYVHEGMHVTANRAYLELFGLASEDEIEGLPIMDMIAPAEHTKFKKLLRELSANNEHSSNIKTTCLRSDSAEFNAELFFTPASIDEEPCTQVVIRDQTITREVEEKLRLLSTQDVQTSLYNRQYFLTQLDEETKQQASRDPKLNTLFYITLDNFTKIRSKIGIKASDSLLLELASLLRKSITQQDILARFGDHTFTILSPGKNKESADQAAKKICDVIESSIQTESNIPLTCSIGVAFSSKDLSSGNDYITQAYQACERARNQDGSSYYIAEAQIPPPEKQSASEANLGSLIQHAFDNAQFQLTYQPIISLHGDTRENYAVTVCLVDDSKEQILPEHFMSQVNDMERMPELDRWIIQHAIEELAIQRKNGKKINFFLNISGASLSDDTLLLFICDCLRDYEAKGSWMTFQFDDTEARSHLSQLQKLADGLKKIKCKTCINHFGLAKRPEAILGSFPIDFVQFHSSFLTDLFENQDKQDRLNHLNEQVQAENIKTITAGVEDANSLAILWSIGVNYIRGYFIQEPSASINYEFNSD
ncbi:MAG: EAL domain-containing protein [Candidatus Thiodiazotropha sp.]|jgi:multidomain signaling protein FimX